MGTRLKMKMLVIERIPPPGIDADSGSKGVLPYCVGGIVVGTDDCLKSSVCHVHLYFVPEIIRLDHLIVIGRPDPILNVGGIIGTLRLAVMALQICDIVSFVVDECL